jgi:hypothetical protein
MEDEAWLRTKKEQAWLRAEEEAKMKAAIWVWKRSHGWGPRRNRLDWVPKRTLIWRQWRRRRYGWWPSDADAEEEQDWSRAEEEADMKVAEEEKVWLKAMVEGQVMSMLMLPKQWASGWL